MYRATLPNAWVSWVVRRRRQYADTGSATTQRVLCDALQYIHQPHLHPTHWSLPLQVEPGAFRDLHAFLQGPAARGGGRLEVLSLAVMAQGATADEFASATFAVVAPAAAPAAAAAGERLAAHGEAGQQGPGEAAQGGERRAEDGWWLGREGEGHGGGPGRQGGAERYMRVLG